MSRIIGLEVTGEAMEPILLEGDVIYIDKGTKPRSNADDLAVLKVKGNYHVCRFTVYGSQILMLHDNAPLKVVKIEDVEIVGKVIGSSYETEIKIPKEMIESLSAANTEALQ